MQYDESVREYKSVTEVGDVVNDDINIADLLNQLNIDFSNSCQNPLQQEQDQLNRINVYQNGQGPDQPSRFQQSLGVRSRFPQSNKKTKEQIQVQPVQLIYYIDKELESEFPITNHKKFGLIYSTHSSKDSVIGDTLLIVHQVLSPDHFNKSLKFREKFNLKGNPIGILLADDKQQGCQKVEKIIAEHGLGYLLVGFYSKDKITHIIEYQGRNNTELEREVVLTQGIVKPRVYYLYDFQQ